MAKLNKKILDGIDNILKTPVKEIPEQIFQGSKKQYTSEQASQVRNEGSEQLTVLDGQVTVDQLGEKQGQQSNKT